MHASKNTVWFDKYSSWQTAIRGGALYSESESKRFGLVAQNKSGMILILTKKKKKKKKLDYEEVSTWKEREQILEVIIMRVKHLFSLSDSLSSF